MADFDPDRLLTERPPSGTVTMTVRPQKLTREDAIKLVRKYNPDITGAAVRGEVDNIMRESGGNAANDTGDHGTSGGLYQHHNERLTGLKKFATSEKADWRDPDIQVRYSRLEKERDYPGLLKLQQSVSDRAKAEDAFKRIFERPASVLWQNNPDGSPVLGNDRYRFSDYAMGEHKGRPGTSIAYMPPQDYLDLTPDLTGKPFTSPSGRSLMKSFNRGEPIEAIPTLDMKVDGNTGTVTDQDGRHRALLAQQEGIDAIPVAIRQQGDGTPTEIQGMSGKLLPNNFVPVAGMPKPGEAQPRQEPPAPPPKAPISLLGQIGQAIMPSAAAAEQPDPFAKYVQPPPPANEADPFAKYTGGAAGDAASTPPASERPDYGFPHLVPELPFSQSIQAGLRGAAKGFGNTVFAGQELVGKGMQAVSDAVMPPQQTMSGLVTGTGPQRGAVGRAGEALTADARERMAAEAKGIAPDKAAHPVATGIGDAIGGMLVPGGAGAKLGGNALRVAAQQGALAGLLTPEGSDNHFWRDKLLEAATGGAGGAVAAKAMNALAGVVAPAVRAGVSNVRKLMSEGVELTPGQMAGGKLRRVEDAMMSLPGIGNQIREAQRRSIQTFNRAAINRSLDDIGVKLPQGLNSGHEAIGFAQDAFTDAYDKVIPRMMGQLDNGMRKDLLDVVTKAQTQNLPQEYQDQLHHIIKTEIVDRLAPGAGRITGADAQTIGTQLDALIKPMRISPNPYVQQMGRLLREADDALDSMMARNNPILQAAKDRIDAGYSKFKTIQQAAASVGTHPDGTFTPAQLNRAVKARDRRKDKAGFARGDAQMQDLAIAGRDVLPQKVPDSGTPERAAVMALLSGHVSAIPGIAASMIGGGAYTAPASKAVNAIVNRLSQPPGPVRNALGDMARGGAQIAAPLAGSLPAAMIQPSSNPP